jgi:2-polyprenyl-6-methoxyphenol hydroxylase-like FAD-dependent oxidoreductase
MFGKTNPEVLVIGAGPVGLCAAVVLAKKGIRVMVVDRQWRTGAHSYALALHSQSLQLLHELAILDDVLERAYRVHTVGLYDRAARRAELRLVGPGGEPCPLAVMRQDVLEHLLEQSLDRLGVKVLWNHAVSRVQPQSDGAVVTVDKLVKESVGYAVAHTEWMVAKSADVHVPFVIGADGHQSLVRRALGIEFPKVAAAQHYAVFEFETYANLGDEMRIMFGNQTTDVLWPLPEQRCRWSFQLVEEDAPAESRVKQRVPVEIGGAEFPGLEEERLRRLIAERAPWFMGRTQQIHWRITVRFERRLAAAFGADRVWLAGDAGHLTGPAGMQSMNVGLQEAKQLADILSNTLREGGSLEPLQEYNRQRIAQWRGLLGLDGGLTPQTDTDPWIRDHKEQLLPCIPASGADLAALARQVKLDVGCQ